MPVVKKSGSGCELLVAVRPDGAARMQIGIDHRTQRPRAFEPWIEVEAQLPGHLEIRALSGRDDDAIDRADRDRSDRAAAVNREAVRGDVDALGAEAGHELQPARGDELFEIGAELAARGKLIGRTAAEDAREIGAAHRPGQTEVRITLGKLRQVEKHVRRRMPAANDEYAQA